MTKEIRKRHLASKLGFDPMSLEEILHKELTMPAA